MVQRLNPTTALSNDEDSRSMDSAVVSTKEIFDWEPIPFEKSILDCANSIEDQI